MADFGPGWYCIEKCWTLPTCTVCKRQKAPRGRDVAAAQHGIYCDLECEGYELEPEAGHLWPTEAP